MRILAIETATDNFGVALVDEARVLASYEVLAQRPHAVELPGAVTRVTQAAGCSLTQLDAIALDIGPGSFTGLRIGLAFVKALLFKLNKPLVSVPSLDVIAHNAAYAATQICPLLDAKQRKVYAALYHHDQGQLVKRSDYQLCTVDELLTIVGGQPVLFLGDGAGLYRERLLQALGSRAAFAAPDLWHPRAVTLGRIARERFEKGQRDDPRDLVPMYLYPMTCSIRLSNRPPNAPRKAGRQASSSASQSS